MTFFSFDFLQKVQQAKSLGTLFTKGRAVEGSNKQVQFSNGSIQRENCEYPLGARASTPGRIEGRQLTPVIHESDSDGFVGISECTTSSSGNGNGNGFPLPKIPEIDSTYAGGSINDLDSETSLSHDMSGFVHKNRSLSLPNPETCEFNYSGDEESENSWNIKSEKVTNLSQHTDEISQTNPMQTENRPSLSKSEPNASLNDPLYRNESLPLKNEKVAEVHTESQLVSNENAFPDLMNQTLSTPSDSSKSNTEMAASSGSDNTSAHHVLELPVRTSDQEDTHL